MTTQDFQRARKPEERTIRRDALLAAAAELFDEGGPAGAGLNAIAARAGFTKSNVYRYFESREEVLLSLFLAEMERFIPALDAAFRDIPAGDVDGIARASAACFEAQPRFCRLLTILSTVLEQNVSEATILNLKREVNRYAQSVGALIQRRLPTASIEDCAWVGSMTAAIVVGIWPGTEPSPAAAAVLARPELSHLRPDLGRDLVRAMRALLHSIA
jgi:AcrR family transcriptional regulator